MAKSSRHPAWVITARHLERRADGGADGHPLAVTVNGVALDGALLCQGASTGRWVALPAPLPGHLAGADRGALSSQILSALDRPDVRTQPKQASAPALATRRKGNRVPEPEMHSVHGAAQPEMSTAELWDRAHRAARGAW
jgi:hypothetical protein